MKPLEKTEWHLSSGFMTNIYDGVGAAACTGSLLAELRRGVELSHDICWDHGEGSSGLTTITLHNGRTFDDGTESFLSIRRHHHRGSLRPIIRVVTWWWRWRWYGMQRGWMKRKMKSWYGKFKNLFKKNRRWRIDSVWSDMNGDNYYRRNLWTQTITNHHWITLFFFDELSNYGWTVILCNSFTGVLLAVEQ